MVCNAMALGSPPYLRECPGGLQKGALFAHHLLVSLGGSARAPLVLHVIEGYLVGGRGDTQKIEFKPMHSSISSCFMLQKTHD